MIYLLTCVHACVLPTARVWFHGPPDLETFVVAAVTTLIRQQPFNADMTRVRLLFGHASFQRNPETDCSRFGKCTAGTLEPLPDTCACAGTGIRRHRMFSTAEPAIRTWAEKNVEVLYHDDDRTTLSTGGDGVRRPPLTSQQTADIHV